MPAGRSTPPGRPLLAHEVRVHGRGRPAAPIGGSAVPATRAPAVQPAIPASAAQPAGRAVAVQPAVGGYTITVGTYMHTAPGLPQEAAGHSFVSIQGPSGQAHTVGFSPAGRERIDLRRDVGVLRRGVPGQVHSDAGAFAKPGVRTRSFEVDAVQAHSAMAKIAEYRSRPPMFSLTGADCGVFARDVMRSAGIEVGPRAGVVSPGDMHRVVRGRGPVG